MLKLLFKVSSLVLFLYACQETPGEKLGNDTLEIKQDTTIIFPSCFLKIDTFLPNESMLENHIVEISDYVIENIPRSVKRDFFNKKYYFNLSVSIEEELLEKYDLNIYLDHINELVKILNFPMGVVNGRPVADIKYSYNSLRTEKGDSSHIKITVKQKTCN